MNSDYDQLDELNDLLEGNEMEYRYYIDLYLTASKRKSTQYLQTLRESTEQTREILSEMDSLSKDFFYVFKNKRGDMSAEKLRRIQR